MPRTGGVYAPPAGTKGTPNTTIQSSKFNSFVDDLTSDANLARPVTAGGTGATNATDARTGLGADDAGNLTKGTVADARLPATMSGKSFNAAVTVSNTASKSVQLTTDGAIELFSTNGAYIDFKNAAGDDYDIRIVQVGSNALDFVATGGVTIGGAKVWTQANDGAGSGLDADLLDGLNSSASGVANTVAIRDGAGALRGNAVIADSAANSGTVFLGNNGQHYLNYDGGNYNLPNGSLYLYGSLINASSGNIYTGVEVEVSGTGNSHYWHKLNGTRRGLTYYDSTSLSMNWNLYNSSGGIVRSLSFREGDGRFQVGGYIHADQGIYSDSEIGVGTARWYGDGNTLFTGGMQSSFGNYLSDALNARPPAASIGIGGIGSYSLMRLTDGSTSRNPGDLVAGSSLAYSTCDGGVSNTATGTWRLMGYMNNGSARNTVSVWLRVS